MKKILFAVTMLLLNLCAYAQTDTIRAEQDHIFQYINKTLIPTGYLNEYGPEAVSKSALNGVLTDSNFVFDIDVFNLLYNDIENSRLNTLVPALLSLDSVRPYINVARYDTVSNLAFFSADYSILREDAVQLNLFTVSGNQLFDVSNRSQSPYIQMHAFAAVPVLPQSPFTNEIRLGCQPLFYGNTGKIVSSVMVNFLDGAGYHVIYSGGMAIPVSKVYTDSSGYKKFSVKVQYTDYSIDECYTQQYVSVDGSAGLQNRYADLTPLEIKTPAHIIQPSAYLNTAPQLNSLQQLIFPHLVNLQHFNQDMKIYIRYSKQRENTPLANEIVKPFIVVEGYDIMDASPLLKPRNYDLNTLLKEWNSLNDLTPSFDINKKLDEEGGYDLIFIDYYTMRSITENADYLLQAIDWINSQKVNNAVGVREQNVVMGLSMGGLVSRYALAKRTNQTGNNSTETRQLITMDSPHQGSNVPLGLQHFLYDLGETKIVRPLKKTVDALQAFYDLNDKPSTQQQLILRVTDGNGSVSNNTFLAPGGTYRTMVDYTAPYEFLAVSNGSQCGKPVMQPGSLILQRSGEVAAAYWVGYLFKNKYRLTVQVNSLPAYGTQAQICDVVMERNIRLLGGLIGTGWHRTSSNSPRISPANTIPWDGVAGGTRSTEAAGPLSESGIVAKIIVNIIYKINFSFSQSTFTFVPITSSLDVQNVTNRTYAQFPQFIFPVNGSNGSRANKYIAQEFSNGHYNIPHTDFTPRNSHWIFNSMQTLPFEYFDCNNPCVDYSILGPSLICATTPVNYTINNLPPGASVTWSVNNLLASVDASGNVTRVGDGEIILSALVAASCGSFTVSKVIKVGFPTIESIVFTSGNGGEGYFCSSHSGNKFTINSSEYIAYNLRLLRWPSMTLVYTHQVVSGENYLNYTATPGWYVLELQPITTCGTGDWYGAEVEYIDCSIGMGETESFGIVASPNPAIDDINISIVNENPAVKNLKDSVEVHIILYDFYSKRADKHWVFLNNKKQWKLNIRGMRKGKYVLQIIKGPYRQSKQVFIN